MLKRYTIHPKSLRFLVSLKNSLPISYHTNIKHDIKHDIKVPIPIYQSFITQQYLKNQNNSKVDNKDVYHLYSVIISIVFIVSLISIGYY